MQWLRTRRTEQGEWAISDLRRNYRVCAYNHQAHGGVHIHAPIEGNAITNVAIRDETFANQVMRSYARKHDEFDLKEFEKELNEWKL